MLRRQHLVGVALISLSAFGCAEGTGPAEGVELRVTAVAAVGATLEYEYELRNERANAIYLPACAQSVRLDFAVETTPPDRFDGSICIAVLDGGPRRIGAGQSLIGRGTVGRHSGVAYAPSVRASASTDLRAAVIVRASKFVAP